MAQQDICWDIDIRLITNPNMVGAWLKAMLATYVLVMLIVGAGLIGTGEASALPMAAGIFALVISGLTVFGLLVMLLVFGNRYRARFEITDDGISFVTLDKRARTLGRLAVVAGGITGNASATGAGLIATSGESLTLRWRGAFAARYLPRRHLIVLRNRWRDLMHVYCTPENYEAVRARVAAEIATHGTEKRSKQQRSPLPRLLLQTALVVIASLPLFALSDLFDLDVFVPILIMLFSLATLWLVPLFGWVVLPALAYVALQIVLSLVETREYTLVSTYRYQGYEGIDPDEWVMLALACVGMIYLGWVAWRAVRGRLTPLLMSDEQDRGG